MHRRSFWWRERALPSRFLSAAENRWISSHTQRPAGIGSVSQEQRARKLKYRPWPWLTWAKQEGESMPSMADLPQQDR